MELSELVQYAAERHHITEERKWADFPGFSVLADPATGKWAALLMRQWDGETGTEIQRCDIKCGQEPLRDSHPAFLCPPFRMKGPRWLGVVFGASTDKATVFRLFERALRHGSASEEAVRRGFTVVLESQRHENPAGPRQETLIPAPGTPGSEGISEASDVPERILEMRRLYEYGPDTPEQRRKNFCRQGEFMADYEDDCPWTGGYHRYFPTYHDLNVPQLRGYFTWRTRMRRGESQPVAASLAYLYLYELLCGVGTDGPEDTLRQMGEFEERFLDAGYGNRRMRQNLHRWMFEYAVVHGLPADVVRAHADPHVLEVDRALIVLKAPEGHDDEQVFFALCAFSGDKLASSAVLKKDEARGKRLFAEVWRYASRNYERRGSGIFNICFGMPRTYSWHPLENAIHREKAPAEKTVFELDECRSYRFENGAWLETRYDPLFFRTRALTALVHEADRVLRRRLKTGHYLKARPEEQWATPLVEGALAEERRRELEASRPKISIDFSGLDQIRRDASITRESLLTEEELAEAVGDVDAAGLGVSRESIPTAAPLEPGACRGAGDAEDAGLSGSAVGAAQIEILHMLVRGEPVDSHLKERHLIPNVVADSINEQVFDIVGDNVVECENGRMSLVEDYVEDVAQIVEEAEK